MSGNKEMENRLICPSCKSGVAQKNESYECAGCGKIFPVRFGIPDFRIDPDPYIGIEEEVEKVRKILGDGSHSFEQLVDRYYEYSPEVSVKLQPHYKAGLKGGMERAQNFLNQAERAFAPEAPIIDIGCGTAGLIAEASRRYGVVIGVDIALRWLALGKQRLREAGIDSLLICANAESLPFADGTFLCAMSDSVLEHSMKPESFIKEMKRVIAPGGSFFLNTANRYSLLESYTGFPLAGFLPRALRWSLIERICHTPYQLNPVSKRQLRSLLSGATELEVRSYRPWAPPGSALRKLYADMTGLPILRNVLSHFGFYLSVSGRYS